MRHFVEPNGSRWGDPLPFQSDYEKNERNLDMNRIRIV